MKKIFLVILCFALIISCCACESENMIDRNRTLDIGNKLAANQPTPTDIDYSLERYNLIKRTYWVNGMREKANALPCPIAAMPLGYVVLFMDTGAVVGRFEVDGKITSLNSFLTPDSEYYEKDGFNRWLPDVDGSYGENDSGIFFFTPDGRYIEWSGLYLYSDIPFEINDPIINYRGN